MRPGWETWRGDFVSCSKRESVTETVLSSCRPPSYVRAVGHNESVYWEKHTATVHSLNHEATAQCLIKAQPWL